MCHTALAAAVLCILSPLALPTGGVPLTLSLLAVLLIAELFSARVAVAATVIYLALGAVGVPVFAGFVGGFQVLIGPNGGFLFAYPFVALVTSKMGGNFKKNCVFGAISTTLCYLLGSLWLTITTNVGLAASLTATFLTCAIFDLFKVVCAALVAETIRSRLKMPPTVKNKKDNRTDGKIRGGYALKAHTRTALTKEDKENE